MIHCFSPVPQARTGANIHFTMANPNPSSLRNENRPDVVRKAVRLGGKHQEVLERFENTLKQHHYLNPEDELSLTVHSAPAEEKQHGFCYSVHTYLNHLDHSTQRRVCSPVGFGGSQALDAPAVKRAVGMYCKSLESLVKTSAL
jgi:hypothetical protein